MRGALTLGKAAFGLITAGTNQNLAATALQRAAAMQSGGALLDGPAKKSSKLGKIGGKLLKGVPFLGGALIAKEIIDEIAAGTKRTKSPPGVQLSDLNARLIDVNKKIDDIRSKSKVPGMADTLARSLEAKRTSIQNQIADIKSAVSQSEKAGQEIKGNLSVQATPQVDTNSIDAAIGKAKQLVNILKQAGTAASSASSSVDASMRRNFPDLGVAP